MKKFILISIFILLTNFIFSADGFFIIHKSFKSKYLTFPHNIIVYLPRDYSNTTKSYPVLYAHDGQNLFDAKTGFGGKEWMLDENIDELVKQGLLDGIIVVGIYNNAERISEYTPSFISNQWVVNQGGKLSNYAKFIVEELKPFIDSNYRTLKDRNNNGVMGSSLGGIASFYILGWYPEVFSKAACISPSFWWDDVRVTNDINNLNFPSDCRIYIDGGFKEGDDESSMIIHMRSVYNLLLKKGLKTFDNIMYYEDPFGAHSEFDWARRGKSPILYLYGNYLSNIKDVKYYIIPNKIGIGDESFLSIEICLKSGLKFTEFFNNIKVLDPEILKFNEGKLIGLKNGKTLIEFNLDNSNYTKEIEILPFSRDIITIKLNIISLNDVSTIKLNVIKENKIETNYFIELNMINKTNGYCEITRKSGTILKYEIANNNGENAYNINDKLIQLSLTFNKNKEVTNVIEKWKIKE